MVRLRIDGNLPVSQIRPGHVGLRHFGIREDGAADDEMRFRLLGQLGRRTDDFRGVEDVEVRVAAVREILMR